MPSIGIGMLGHNGHGNWIPTIMKGTIFVNTSAGSMKEQELAELRERISSAGLDLIEIEAGVDYQKLIRERIAAGRLLFIVAGGDGSIHHVIQAMIDTEGILGILPLGTFNHLAKDFGIPLDWREALELALHGETRQIDAGVVNGRYFLNNIILGVYPAMLYQRERLRSKGGAWRAYARALPVALKRFPHVTLTMEGPHHLEAVKSQFLAVSVSAWDLTATGFVAPRTSSRGALSIYWFPFSNRWSFMKTLTRYLLGKIDQVDGFRQLASSELKLSAVRPRMRFSVDGEIVEMTSPLRVRFVPSGLRLRLPAREASVPAI